MLKGFVISLFSTELTAEITNTGAVRGKVRGPYINTKSIVNKFEKEHFLSVRKARPGPNGQIFAEKDSGNFEKVFTSRIVF
jgi:hypothetical protein